MSAALTSAADVPPGGEATIEVSVSTHGRSGQLTKVATVETNDPDNAVVRLQLSGNVVVEAALDPQRIALGQVSRGERVTKQAVLTAREPGKVRITGVEVVSESEGLTARLTKQDGRDAVEVSFQGKQIGPVRGQVKVSTSAAKAPTIDLWVLGEVVGTFDLVPRSVSFAEPESGGAPPRAVLEVRPRGETRHRVTEVRDPSGSVDATVSRRDEAWRVDLVLTKVPETRRGVLEIATTDPDQRTIEARYFVRQTRVSPIQPRRIVPPREDLDRAE